MAVAPPSQATTTPRRAGLGWRVAGAFLRMREASIVVVAAGLFLYFTAANPFFFDSLNFQTMAEYAAPIMLVAAGQVFLLICGEIDLSLGHVYALTAFVVIFATDVGIPIGLALPLGLLAAAGVGLTNGLITVFVRVPSFITTLGMAFFLNGVTLTTTDASVRERPGQGHEGFIEWFGHYVSIWHGIPLVGTFLWALAILIALQVVLSRTRWGMHTIATGGNLIGAAESGVSVRRVKIGNFVLASMLAGFAGVLESVRIESTFPLQGGFGLTFLGVGAAVIGGTSLFGGAGTIAGAFLGVAVLVILNIGFTLEGTSANTLDLIFGLTIIIAMVVNSQLQRLRNIGRFARR
jgi:simple sugar transport system permease protein